MKEYKLLTPGPLTTTSSVKEAMLVDHCTWDEDYKVITTEIRRALLAIAQATPQDYTAVLMQGSGTFGVESVLTSAIGKEEKVLLLANGVYGQRMIEIAEQAGIAYACVLQPDDRPISAEVVEQNLIIDPDITHVAMVHCETTSGVLNEVAPIAALAKTYGKRFILDAMSSFGGVELPVADLEIDFLISSANKCIQGVPGFSFVIAKTESLEECRGKSPSLSLDLYDQWQTMKKDGKWRFTSPTHVVLAFAQALRELEQEGGVGARAARYRKNQSLLVTELAALGIRAYVPQQYQSPIITSFVYPQAKHFSFSEMYEFIKERGYAIYPGKVTAADTFRIGNIGEIYEEDIRALVSIMKAYLDVAADQEIA